MFSDEFSDILKKKVQQHFKDIPNVYTQYRPHVESLIEDVLKGRLKESEYVVTDSKVNLKTKYPVSDSDR